MQICIRLRPQAQKTKSAVNYVGPQHECSNTRKYVDRCNEFVNADAQKPLSTGAILGCLLRPTDACRHGYNSLI